jgi:hypothetical protein
MATRQIFWGFCINRFGIGPLHYIELFRFWLGIRGDIRNPKMTHRLDICTTRGILVHPCTNRGLMNRKNDRIESWFRYIPLENRCGGARSSTGTYMDRTARESLGISFLEVHVPHLSFDSKR